MKKAFDAKGDWGKPKPKPKSRSAIDFELEKKIIKKINELYITERKKYLIMKPYGGYISVIYGREYEPGKIDKRKLNDSELKKHLRGKETIGVFAGSLFSKFMCFDADVPDLEKAKWVTYKLVHSLIDLGIPERYIHISFSGTKGYHIEIFFSSMVSNDLILKLYKIALTKADLLEFEDGEIELRPQAGLGVKLPLGINFKNKDDSTNRCWYVSYEDGLKLIKKFDYILSIEQIDKQILLDVIEKYEDIIEEPKDKPKPKKDKKSKKKDESSAEDIKASHKPLESYRQNVDEEVTVEAIEELIRVGIQKLGTRHNILIKIAKYFKSVLRYEPDDCEKALIEWMELQDKSKYTTSRDDCVLDISKIVEWVYGKNIGLTTSKPRDLTVTKAEMDAIMILEDKLDKIILYAMLIHSKRYARENGVFYMTFEQIEEVTGISDKAVRNHVNDLEAQGAIQIVARNQIIKKSDGEYSHSKPNEYKITLTIAEIEKESPVFTILDGGKDSRDSYFKNVCIFYTNKQLKNMVKEQQLREFRKYRKSMSMSA